MLQETVPKSRGPSDSDGSVGEARETPLEADPGRIDRINARSVFGILVAAGAILSQINIRESQNRLDMDGRRQAGIAGAGLIGDAPVEYPDKSTLRR